MAARGPRVTDSMSALLLASVLAVAAPLPAAAQEVHAFNVIAADPASAIHSFGVQAGIQILASADDLRGKKLNPVTGKISTEQALNDLLAGTGLDHRYVGDRAIALVAESTATGSEQNQASQGAKDNADNAKKVPLGQIRVAQVDQGKASSDSSAKKEDEEQASKKKPVQLEEMRVTLPEVLVIGSKSLNMDIQRTPDDVQPYVVFDRAAIENSGATNIEDFLKQRLTMNSVGTTNGQGASGNGNMSEIDLYGLGANQTLILIDGHRAASPVTTTGTTNTPFQPDLNGIPLAAVERIEVLPTTASGIYGGGATGGVVNVILRRDYTGAELALTYGNTFDAAAATRRVDLNSGFSFEGGRTNVLFAASWSKADTLQLQNRDFAEKGRAAILANNPGFFFNAPTPPLGATTNIRSADGSPLFGPGTSNITFVPVGYAGGGGLAPLQANAGHYNLDLANTAQTGGGEKFNLLNSPTVESLTTTIRRQFTPNLEVFLDLMAANNTSHILTSVGFGGIYFIPASAANNPFGQGILVAVPLPAADSSLTVANHDRRVVGGFTVKLAKDWSAEADYTWDQVRFSSYESTLGLFGAAAAVGSGSVDVLRDVNAFPVDFSQFLLPPTNTSTIKSTLKDTTLRVAGPIGSLPGGAPTLSTLVEHRDEKFGEALVFFPPFGTGQYPDRSQTVDSAYVELRVPLASPQNNVSGIRELELQVAGRYVSYHVDGATRFIIVGSGTPVARTSEKLSSTNPTVGLRYRPVADLTLRASYGTGFLPPSVSQLTTSPPGSAGGIFDPRRGNEMVFPQAVSGGNNGLRPEESTSWSAGAIITPKFAPRLRASLDYTRIKKKDNITGLGFQQVVDNENLFPSRVVRGPVAPGDPFGVGPITFIDATAVNISRAEVEAYDVSIDYHGETTRLGSFDPYFLATWQTHYKTQLIPNAPVVESVGIDSDFGNPIRLKFKANAGLTWKYRHWALGWTARYFNSYVVADPSQSFNVDIFRNQGSLRVPSQTYHDLFVSYRFGQGGAQMLTGLEVKLGIRNVFHTEPPFDANQPPVYYSPFGDPRISSYSLSVKKSFGGHGE
jgi:iron complex outermembrane receptor protein